MTSSRKACARSGLARRKQAPRRQAGEQGELDVVDQGATLERIQIVDSDSDLTRDDSLDGVKKEAVWAAREGLQRGRRIAASVERVLYESPEEARSSGTDLG